MRPTTVLAVLLVLAAIAAMPQGADGAKGASTRPVGVAGRLVLDLRVTEAEMYGLVVCAPPLDLSQRFDTLAWLAALPDSLVARVARTGPMVRALAYCEGEPQVVRIQVEHEGSECRSTSLTNRSPGLHHLWTWDLRDSTGVRVTDGVYRVRASVGERTSAGWVIVEPSSRPR